MRHVKFCVSINPIVPDCKANASYAFNINILDEFHIWNESPMIFFVWHCDDKYKLIYGLFYACKYT